MPSTVQPNVEAHPRGRGVPRLLTPILAMLALVIATTVTAGPAAAFSVLPPGDPSGNGFVASVSTTQAGGHPDAVTSFTFTPAVTFADQFGGPLKSTVVELPRGFVGNPEAVGKCSYALLAGANGAAQCPHSSQVGTIELEVAGNPVYAVGLYVLDTSADRVASLGFNVADNLGNINAAVRPDDDGLRLSARSIPNFAPISAVKVTIWGVPADPIHDSQRCPILDGIAVLCNGSPGTESGPHEAGVARAPFTSNPTVCDGPKITSISVESWYEPGVFSEPVEVANPTPTGCDDLPFGPTLSATPTSGRPDSPTGLVVDLAVPQAQNPDGLSTAHLKKAVVTLPEGMRVNSASADGLAACAPAEIGLDTDSAVTCPAASKIGDVVVDTPLLAAPLTGDVFLAKQDDNPFGSLLALYIVARGPGGLMLKLPGRVDADPLTGRLTTTFDDNPQLPFSNLHLELKSGPRAPLITPSVCGDHTTRAELESWNGRVVTSDTTFTIDEGCAPGGFHPSWSAGSTNPVAGAFSPFVARFTRSEHEELFKDVAIDVPLGILAQLRGVPLCGDDQASTGACPAGSRIGSATVGAGAGGDPYYLTNQPVYLTGPYKGAPYGLAVVARVLAGPFDLGTVVVRQAIHVDSETARLDVVSDPLPQILRGIPLTVRDVRVRIDRPSFVVNPTSCAERSATATLTSTHGAVHRAAERFQVGDCASLPFRPRLSMRLLGRKQLKSGRHPALRAALRQGPDQANIRAAKVVLPSSLALDPDNARALCEFEEGRGADFDVRCGDASVIGRARVVTPLLNEPLMGSVYFVKNVRIHPRTGNPIRTLPMLRIALRGEVDIDLTGTSSVRRGRLVTTFANIPDAPVSRFDLRLFGGRRGILVANKNLCRGRHVAAVETDGQNGKQRDFRSKMKTPCRAAKRGKARRKTG